MKYSLIALAVLASMGQQPQLEEGEALPVALSNEELPTEIHELAVALEDIAANARYAADARKPAADMARVLAAYFRTPDAPAAAAA